MLKYVKRRQKMTKNSKIILIENAYIDAKKCYKVSKSIKKCKKVCMGMEKYKRRQNLSNYIKKKQFCVRRSKNASKELNSWLDKKRRKASECAKN